MFCVFIFIWCFIFQFWKYPKKKSVVCKIPDLLSVWLIEAVALRARDCHWGVEPSCSLHILSHHCHTLSHSLHPHPPLCQRPSPQEHSRSRASRQRPPSSSPGASQPRQPPMRPWQVQGAPRSSWSFSRSARSRSRGCSPSSKTSSCSSYFPSALAYFPVKSLSGLDKNLLEKDKWNIRQKQSPALSKKLNFSEQTVKAPFSQEQLIAFRSPWESCLNWNIFCQTFVKNERNQKLGVSFWMQTNQYLLADQFSLKHPDIEYLKFHWNPNNATNNNIFYRTKFNHCNDYLSWDHLSNKRLVTLKGEAEQRHFVFDPRNQCCVWSFIKMDHKVSAKRCVLPCPRVYQEVSIALLESGVWVKLWKCVIRHAASSESWFDDQQVRFSPKNEFKLIKKLLM